jgi:ferredoxin, 2Fe-2S
MSPEKGVSTYRITLLDAGRSFEVDPTRPPPSLEGAPGSLLALLLGNGVHIEHACGGVGGCSTCHVHVVEGGAHGNEPDDRESDAIEHAPDLSADSRLACQFFPDGTGDIVIRVPTWNRNAVGEER